MAARSQFVRLPSRWIIASGLKGFTWASGAGAEQNAAHIVALMVLILIAHDADQTTGVAKITYDQMVERSSSSRAMVSVGLKILLAQGLITKEGQGRSSLALVGFEPLNGWAKLPAKRLYDKDVVTAFTRFKLRVRTELDALKLYLLLLAFRENETNLARISYAKISEYTGIATRHITAAGSFLNGLPLIYTEWSRSTESDHGISNAYRIVGIDPYVHRGTRGALPVDEADLPF
jgi:hypothetical protein